ncbi:MAG TPA: type II secretion system protein GspF, partial [Steroidobacteraceae bacterium]
MGAFEYTALDAGGRERKGIIEGDTARQVRQLLRERELLPVAVAELAQREAKRQTGFTLLRGLSAADVSLLTRQL